MGATAWRGWLGVVVLLGVGARLAVMVPAPRKPLDDPENDPDNYRRIARSLRNGEGFALNGKLTAYRPPLYALLLVPADASRNPESPGGVWRLHLMLGGATIAFTGLTARRWGLSWERAILAAALVAFDPVLVVQSKTAMTETLSAALVAMTLAALADREGLKVRDAVLGGLGFGLLGLCRPSVLPSAALVIVAEVVTGQGGWSRRIGRAAIVGVVVVATMSPWAYRNWRLFGEPVWSSTHGGYTLAMANNPVYYREILDGPPGAVWGGQTLWEWRRDITLLTMGLSEPEANRRLSAEGWRMLRERPGTFCRASIARLGKFWAVAPSESVYPLGFRIATALWTVPFWIALVVALLQRESWRWPRVGAIAMIAGLSAVHAIYWTDLRMRAPIVPALALLAASARRPGRILDLP
ncbi:MAG TPA: dolichyl-phosphate-mannose-protein mannosyltransferase [Isosphaeraceae bacterium]|jgi:hypothetical protein|nr:dolichyl-phosphate-mannose-protein mannosyltransferase [Isosphaeraceae bacterium]